MVKEWTVYHVLFEDEMWVVKNAKGIIIDRTFTKDQAVEFGRRRATSALTGKLIVHSEDGAIERELVFGQDPPQQAG